MSDLIKATDVNVSRQGKKILDEVSVSLGHHDFLTIIGPNGAGKSMLLKCLMGFYLPDAGIVKGLLDCELDMFRNTLLLNILCRFQ